ncbi:MAG: pyridoxamine 5'-phosphate oxidase family protein, partial [Candidatus Competibacter sp.]
MNLQEQRLMVNLIRSRRWAALATQGPDGSEASWVAYVPEPDFSGFLLHLSTLSAHTRNLLADPRAGLAISEPERDGEDPQTLARVTVQGAVAII